MNPNASTFFRYRIVTIENMHSHRRNVAQPGKNHNASTITPFYLLVKKSLTTSDTHAIIDCAKEVSSVPTKGSDRITVRFPEPLHSQLLRFARQEETSPSAVIRKATREFILKSNSDRKSEKP